MTNNIALPIAESELIITAKNTIYHLDLAPHQLADTVITVGDPGRVEAVSRHFDRIEHKAAHREFVTHTGYIGNKAISVVSTGIGPDNIDIVFNELDALANIDFASRTIKDTKRPLSIIRLGTCGALQADIPVDIMVVSSHGIGLDNLMLYYNTENTPDEHYIIDEFVHHTHVQQRHIAPYITESAISLRKHFGAGYVHGITVSCPGFYGPQGRQLRLAPAIAHLPEALSSFRCRDMRITNFEMETSAIYGLGRLLGHKCLSVSTVVANRANKTFSSDGNRAVEQMIARSLEIIAAI